MNKQITTNSEKETFEFAKNFAKELKGREVIGLVGDLGAGKTVFTKGLAKGLNIKDNINSPTFVVMKIYDIRNSEFGIRNLVHVDAYRLKSEHDLKNIGLEEYLNRNDVIVLIEWADRVKKILPKNAILINIEHSEENNRIVKIKNAPTRDAHKNL